MVRSTSIAPQGAPSGVTVSRLVGRYDLVLVSAVLALTGLGLLLVLSTTGNPGADLTDAERLSTFWRQAWSTAIGLVAMFIFRFLRPETFARFTLPLLLTGLGLILAMAFGLVGTKYGGSRRWLSLAGMTFQPGELVKMAWVIWMAWIVAKYETDISRLKIMGLIVAFGGALAGAFVLQRDLGTGVIIGVTMISIMLCVGIGKRQTTILFILLGLMVAVAAIVFQAKLNRIVAHLDIGGTRKGVGFQLFQAAIGIGSGGLFGKGLGHGSFHILRFIPESESDFILAVAGEELGFVGLALITMLYVVIAVCGYRIARMCKTPFRRNLAFLITLLLTMSAAIHMLVNVALIPAKGLVCPFMSKGGTAMIVSFACIGILQRLHIDATASNEVTEGYLNSLEGGSDYDGQESI